MKIAMARGTINPIMGKIGKILSEKHTVTSLSIYEPTEDIKKCFNNSIYLLPLKDKEKQYGVKSKLLSIYDMFKKRKELKKQFDLTIGVSEPNIFVWYIFSITKGKKVFFPYDIVRFKYKNILRNKWYDFLFERSNFKKADAIIHKGPENELQGITSKPSLQFLPYCEEEQFIHNKEKQQGIHLVYVGLVYDTIRTDGLPLIDNFIDFTKQGFHVHIFPSEYSRIEKQYQTIFDNNPLLYLHESIYGLELKKEISKYHYGLYFLDFSDKIKPIWEQTVFGNKVSDYLEAGLPILTSGNLSFVSKIIRENNFGIVMNPKLIQNLKNAKYKDIEKHILNNRKSFTMKKHKKRLYIFLEKI